MESNSYQVKISELEKKCCDVKMLVDKGKGDRMFFYELCDQYFAYVRNLEACGYDIVAKDYGKIKGYLEDLELII